VCLLRGRDWISIFTSRSLECVYCAVRTGYFHLHRRKSNLLDVPWLRCLVRRPGFDSSESLFDFWWTNCSRDSFFSYHCFPLSVSFHQCSIQNFIYMLLLLEEPSNASDAVVYSRTAYGRKSSFVVNFNDTKYRNTRPTLHRALHIPHTLATAVRTISLLG